MQSFDVLADPARRRILELLAPGEVAAGDLARAVGAEFGLSQPAVSQHLKVLRENGFAAVRVEGTRRLYSLDRAPLAEVGAWVNRLLRTQPAWQSLDALATEVARGKRSRSAQPRPQPRQQPEEKIS